MSKKRKPKQLRIEIADLPELAQKSDDVKDWVFRACRRYASELSRVRKRGKPQTYAERADYLKQYARDRRARLKKEREGAR